MKSNMDDELSLEKIDDYKGTESKEKRTIVKLVIIFCIIIGAIIGFLKYNNQFDDYIGTKEAQGIANTTKY